MSFALRFSQKEFICFLPFIFSVLVSLGVVHGLQESGQVTIVLKAMGRAINKAVTIAEILKRKMPLHQWNNVSSVEMIDVYEPVEEGLDVVTSRRYVSCMQITLSLTLAESNSTLHPGYQAPLVEEEMHQQQQQHHHHSGPAVAAPVSSQHPPHPHGGGGGGGPLGAGFMIASP